MSNSDPSSTLLSHNTYVISSASEDLIVQNLGANNAAEGDQEVTQPVGNNDQNEDTHQGPNQQPAAANEQNVIRPNPRLYIGLIICKECNGTKYLGHVVGYNDQRKWFRVKYGEEEFEDMDGESVLRLRAKQSDVFAARAQASGSGSATMNHMGGSRKRSKKEEGYIPLALRETKKDAYYYY